MIKYSGLNRGYGFVVYSTLDEAKECIRDVLNNHEIRKRRRLGVCKSVGNCHVYVGGKEGEKGEIESPELQKITQGVVDVIVHNSESDKSKKQRFCLHRV